jgi:hypothetical protein
VTRRGSIFKSSPKVNVCGRATSPEMESFQLAGLIRGMCSLLRTKKCSVGVIQLSRRETGISRVRYSSE